MTKPTSADRYIGQRISTARRAASMTLRQLADKTSARSPQRLQKYEAGEISVPAVILYEIATALDTRIDWFFPTPHKGASRYEDASRSIP